MRSTLINLNDNNNIQNVELTSILLNISNPDVKIENIDIDLAGIDACILVELNGNNYIFAIEYECNIKSKRRYQEIFLALKHNSLIRAVLFITPNTSIQKSLMEKDENEKLNPFVGAYFHMIVMETTIEKQEKELKKYRDFFSSLGDLLPQSFL
jgi:hypothetical protein